ncbi:MAG TPA: segregation/condensation protein A [Candidatus Omnitrophota bacterium]|nr:segregation/condensation protein A [Candidatus Omnitrophota bacterium]
MTEPFQITIPKYEGPFDLILDAIREGKIDIFEISLTQITSAYFEYMGKMKEIDLNLASEFILTAAYLLEIKSKRLLPKPEEVVLQQEEEEIETDLADHIKEYQRFKQVAVHLKQKKESFSRIYSRIGSPDDAPVQKDFYLKDVNLNDLVLAFQRVFRTISDEENVQQITADEVTLPQRIDEVVEMLGRSEEGVAFEQLFIRRTRIEVVVTFLAVLELCRRNMINILQEERFSGIYLRLKKA